MASCGKSFRWCCSSRSRRDSWLPRFIRQGPRADALSGTLLITGVSPRPDATGEQIVTIAGVIDGPTLNEYTVYQRMTADVDKWPTVGELKPVVYSAAQSRQVGFRAADRRLTRSAVADVQQFGQVRQFHPRPSVRLTGRSFMLVDQLPVRVGDDFGLA